MKKGNNNNYLFLHDNHGTVSHHFSAETTGRRFLCGHVGTSMIPTLTSSDLLEIEPYTTNKPATGDVILCRPSNDHPFVIHRIISTSSGRYTTRGDNCNKVDLWNLHKKDIYGRVIAAHQGQKFRKVAGGYIGLLTGISCQIRRRVNNLVVRFCGPIYRSLITGGFLHWLIPVRLTPQISTFQTNTTASHRLLLGRRIIGTYDESLLRWQIRRPYRLLVDESALPKPE